MSLLNSTKKNLQLQKRGIELSSLQWQLDSMLSY